MPNATAILTAVIIDDEEKGRKVMQAMLAEMADSITVLGVADAVASGAQLIEQTKPQLVFLDIEMADGSGFDLLNQLPHLSFHLVFVTGYSHYALKAIKFSAIDYLLKPVNPIELANAVAKAQQHNHDFEQLTNQLQVFLSNIKPGAVPKLVITGKDIIRFVALTDIIHCESDGGYTHFHLTNNKKVTATKILKEYAEMLENAGFFRIHHSYLINLAHLEGYVRGEGGTAILSNGIRLEVSRRKKAAFLEAIHQR